MQRLSRNAPCWCGSGKKYKHCHLQSDLRQHDLRQHDPRQPGPTTTLVKTPAQIQGIRAACQLTRDILDRLQERIAAGVTTAEIDGWVHEDTLAHGGRPATLGYRGYPKSVCTSINNVIVHGIPDETALREGDILNVDVTTILDGYYGDSSRMFLIGQVAPEARRLVEVTRQCLDLGIAQVKPGNAIGDIGHAIQQHAEGHGYSVVRDFVGHGTGLQFHEGLQIPHFGAPGSGGILVPDMVFTIEPMINAGGYQMRILEDGWTAVTADGSLSAQWEHTVRVTEGGVEVLTA